MEIKEYRNLTTEQRQFAAMYGMRSAHPHLGLTPLQFMAAHFAGLLKIEKHDFIYCMQGAGNKLLLFYNIDCRTPAEAIRSELNKLKTRDAPSEPVTWH